MSNVAIRIERNITPTIDDLICDLNGSIVFSKLDLNAGYHQLELYPDSSYMTTFSTHVGLLLYKRVSFENISEDITGCQNIPDDIVHGKTEKQHDGILRESSQEA